ncbi:MAG: response regulator [Anaerolineae bacterium]|nr:response regulator [Anaerolineae bacterium]
MIAQGHSLRLNNLLHQITENLTEGVAIVDGCGQVVYANTLLEQLLGASPGALSGSHWMDLFTEATRRFAEAWRVSASQEPRRQCELEILRRDGTEIPVLLNSSPLHDAHGEHGLLATFADLRERHHFEAELERLEKVAAMTNHVSSVAHELNNSLTILVLQTQLLSRKPAESNEFGESLAIIQDQAKRMIQMVDDLRSSTDPYELCFEYADVNALLERTLELMECQLEADQIQIEVELDRSLPVASVDPHRLQQVFVNLINNSRQALASGQMPRKLKISTGFVTTGLNLPPRVRIVFADTGPGISEEIMPHIFEPFVTSKTPEQGMGLGLAICEKIVERHGGIIWAEPNTPHGAVLILELPIAQDGDEEATLFGTADGFWRLDKLSPHDPDADCHILVVDDEPAVAELVQGVLEHAGYRVTTTHEPRNAISILEQGNIDLIVSDMSMPLMNGEQFWQAVAEHHPRLARRIIFSSGDSSGGRARAFLESSGCAYIRKPFDPQDLIQLVRETLQDGSEAVPMPR